MDDKTLGYLLYVAIFVLLFGLGYWIITRVSKIEPKYKPEKNLSEKEKKEAEGNVDMIWGFIVVAVIGVAIYFAVSFAWKETTGYIDDKSDAKEYCAKHEDVINAKTDFAAKKAYETCLSNY